MAIQRCPYCKAIIDEDLEYCSNCGTRLLFPEDEFIEEEIPGEKIVDEEVKAEEPEQEVEIRPKKKRKERKKKEKDGLSPTKKEEIAEIENEDLETEKEEPIEDEEKTEELSQAEIEEESDELVDLEQEMEMKEKPEGESETEEELQAEEEIEEEIVEPAEEDLSREEEKSQEIDLAVEQEEGEIEEYPDKSEEVDFKTADLEKIVDSAEKEKEDIEKFLDSLREERKKHEEIEEGHQEREDELPPWAAKIKEAPPTDIPVSQEKEEKEELLEPEEEVSYIEKKEHLEPEEAYNTEEETGLGDVQAVDTGVGIPEKIDQQDLPFDGYYEEEETGIIIPRKERKASRFAVWLKSRIFDVFFVVLLWFVTLWIASHVIDVSIFQLISSSTWESLGFLAALLAVYFFLFLFFLGETIGSYFFSREE